MSSKKKLWKILFTKIVALHICCWLLFIVYELLFLFYIYKRLEPVPVYLCYYSLNILFFYSNAKLLSFIFDHPIPKYIKGIIYFIILVAIYLTIKFSISYLLYIPHLTIRAYLSIFLKFLPDSLFRLSYFTVLSTFYWATGHISYFRKQAAAAEKQELLALKDKAELEVRLAEANNAYLAQQINPHLLFNSLSFIYSSVIPYSDAAAKCVLLVTDLMRFSLEETGPDGKVALADEIQQIERLLEINRLRFNRPPAIGTLFEGNFAPFRVIPLILFTLTENIIKHGDLNQPASPALLQLTTDEKGNLTYFSRNLKKPESGYARRRQVGLQNVRIRLDFAYPGKYSLAIADTAEYYELTLNLSL